MRRRRLRTRLVASFVAVALVGVGTLAVLVIAILPSRLSQLVIQRQNEAAERAAEMLEETYRLREGWSENGLRGAAEIAADAGGSIDVETGSGGASDTATHPRMPSHPARASQEAPTTPPGARGTGLARRRRRPTRQGRRQRHGSGGRIERGSGEPQLESWPGRGRRPGPRRPGRLDAEPGHGGRASAVLRGIVGRRTHGRRRDGPARRWAS